MLVQILIAFRKRAAELKGDVPTNGLDDEQTAIRKESWQVRRKLRHAARDRHSPSFAPKPFSLFLTKQMEGEADSDTERVAGRAVDARDNLIARETLQQRFTSSWRTLRSAAIVLEQS